MYRVKLSPPMNVVGTLKIMKLTPENTHVARQNCFKLSALYKQDTFQNKKFNDVANDWRFGHQNFHKSWAQSRGGGGCLRRN